MLQYKEFTNYVNIHCKDEFLKFNVLPDKRYTFLECDSLCSTCNLSFTLSHGQSHIERGFSINNKILVVIYKQNPFLLKDQFMII